MFALIENGAVKQYPYNIAQLKKANPNVSFPKSPSDKLLASFNVQRVFNTTPPKSDKDVADMQQRLDVMVAEIAALGTEPRTSDEDERLQLLIASHEVETQFLQNLPAPYGLMTSVLEEQTPVFDTEAQRWSQVWSVRELTADEVTQRQNALQQTIVEQTQQRLDDFARTRNYDGILSLCTYVTSTVPKFQSEGQYGVEARDATYATLYTLLAEIQTDTRPMPSGFADIEPELPVLEWPTQPE